MGTKVNITLYITATDDDNATAILANNFLLDIYTSYQEAKWDAAATGENVYSVLANVDIDSLCDEAIRLDGPHWTT
jgi:hypothetical protein